MLAEKALVSPLVVVITWPADDPELDRRLATKERRIGLVAVVATTFAALFFVWTWAATWRVFDWIVPSVLPSYGPIALAAIVGVWFLLRTFTGFQVATVIVGLMVVVAGVWLGMSRLTAGRSRGWCKSVIGDMGIHGDNYEECFDARASRATDVAITWTFGLLTLATGVALVAQPETRQSGSMSRNATKKASGPTGVRSAVTPTTASHSSYAAAPHGIINQRKESQATNHT